MRPQRLPPPGGGRAPHPGRGAGLAASPASRHPGNSKLHAHNPTHRPPLTPARAPRPSRAAGSASYKGKDLFELEPEERSHAGLFLSFQSPIEIPGVSNVDFLRMACNSRRKALGQAELDPLEFYAYVVPKVRPRGRPPQRLPRPQAPLPA